MRVHVFVHEVINQYMNCHLFEFKSQLTQIFH